MLNQFLIMYVEKQRGSIVFVTLVVFLVLSFVGYVIWRNRCQAHYIGSRVNYPGVSSPAPDGSEPISPNSNPNSNIQSQQPESQPQLAANVPVEVVAANSQAFPTISLSYMDPTTINPQAYSYQMADYDAQRNQVIFYPYGSITPPIRNSGVLLTYNVGSNNFTSPSSWTTADLRQIVNPDAVNFGGGFLDTEDNFAYLPPGAKGYNGTTAQKVTAYRAIAVQVNLAKQYANPNDPTAYSSISLRTLPGVPDVGGFSGIFANGYAYFCPTIDSSNGVFHGVLIRYKSSRPFSATSSWEWYNLNHITSPPDSALGGMQSMAYVAPYVYLIPFANGNYKQVTMASKIVRYHTTKNFQSASSYQTFDLTSLPVPSGIQTKLKGFTGGIVVGNKLILVPWGLRNTRQTQSVALMFDTTKQLNDPTAWQYIDLTTVNPKAGGYQFGWIDKNGFVWFVPTHNYNIKPSIPPFVVWNSNLPFNSASSWTSYPNTKGIWSTGAAYDPTTNTAWFAPYGQPAGGTLSARITQLQESFSAFQRVAGAGHRASADRGVFDGLTVSFVLAIHAAAPGGLPDMDPVGGQTRATHKPDVPVSSIRLSDRPHQLAFYDVVEVRNGTAAEAPTQARGPLP